MHKRFFFYLLGILLFSSCVKPTKACFVYSVEDYLTHTILFDASCSQSASFFDWDFGDGDTSIFNSQDTLSHSYLQSGDYTVTLKATRKDGFTLGKDIYTKSAVIHVP